jgi:hypothetical protein
MKTAAKSFEDIEHAIRYNYDEISEARSFARYKGPTAQDHHEEKGAWCLRMKEIGQGKTEGGYYTPSSIQTLFLERCTKRSTTISLVLRNLRMPRFVQRVEGAITASSAANPSELVLKARQGCLPPLRLDCLSYADLSDRKRADGRDLLAVVSVTDSRRFKM